jgi:uncharacterized protein (UPF0254 family)
MKKALPFILALTLLVAAGVGFYFYQKLSAQGAAAQPMVADYLPADTLLLLSLPDPKGTLADWKTTDLYKIWDEPEVRAFFEKPLSNIPSNKEFNDTLVRIDKISPKHLFVALTGLDEKTNQPHVLAGFQFKGDSKDVDQLLAGPKDALRKNFPAGKADLLNYQGRSIEIFEGGKDNTMASVFLEDWYLISNDLNLLKASLDRIERRAPANQSTLEKDADFQGVCAKLPKGHETLIFARMQPILQRLYAFAAASGQTLTAEQRAESEKIKAIGATTRLENGKIRDTIYYLAPGLKSEWSTLKRSSLPITSADTLLYAAGVLDIPTQSNLPGGAATLAILEETFKEFTTRGLTLESFRAAFGNEAGTQLDWAANTSQPTLLITLEVRDRAAAEKFVASLTTMPIGDAVWEQEPLEGAIYHKLTIPSVPILTPTLTVTDKHLIIGLHSPEVRGAVSREKAGGDGIVTRSEAYKNTTGMVAKPNVSFAYLDSKAAFERVYALVKSAVMMAPIFVPQIGQYADLNKLPPTETISRHLSPVVFSQTLDAEGLTLESVGPVTFAQVGIGLGAGIGAAAVPMLQKQYGALLPGMGAKPPVDEDDAPAASPSPTPEKMPADE